MKSTFTLRDYQMDAVNNLRKSYMSGKRAPLLVLPTGSGKTACFSYIAQSIEQQKRRAIILVHRRELLMQASDSLTRLGVKHGIISAGFAMSNHPIQVASVQTIVRRLHQITEPNLIITDECHHATSNSYKNIFDHFKNSYLLGVTATPCRTDGTGLNKIFDDMIIGPSISNLIERKFLVEPIVFAPPIGIDLTGVKNIGGDYDKHELETRIDKPSITGDAVKHWIKYARGKPSIAFCTSIAHAGHVADNFRNAGFRSDRIDGNTKNSDRQRLLEDLGNGRLDVLTSADLIGEGVDVPACSAAILLRPTQSLALYLQQVGRALRPMDGKTNAIILDHVGNVARHGFPTSDFEWTLEGQKRSKKKTDNEEKISVSQCKICYFAYESGPDACPNCGHKSEIKARTIKETEGDLKQITREQIEAKKIQARKLQGSAKTIDDLIAIGISRGYKNPRYWAEKIMMGRRRR